MKILFFLIDMNVGGTEKAFLNLLKKLPSTYKVSLLLLKKQGGFLSEIPNHVEVFEIDNEKSINFFINNSPLKTGINLIKSNKIRSGFYTLFNYLKWRLTKDFSYNFKSINNKVPNLNKQFDIAIAYAGPHDFISYYIAQKVKAKKKIQWIHFDVSKITFHELTSQKIYKNFDEIKAVSEDVRNQFLKALPKLDKKIKVLHNTVCEDTIIEMSKKENSCLANFAGVKIVTVGRISKEKGHELFIPGLRKLIDEGYNLRWYLIGDGSCKSKLIEMVNEFDLCNHIFFEGIKINPYPYMQQADIYLQPSYYEGHCVTILEAKILNKPIISTNFSGALEEIKDGITGLVVDVSSEGLYSGVKRMLDDKKLCQSFIVNLKKENLESIDRYIEL